MNRYITSIVIATLAIFMIDIPQGIMTLGQTKKSN